MSSSATSRSSGITAPSSSAREPVWLNAFEEIGASVVSADVVSAGASLMREGFVCVQPNTGNDNGKQWNERVHWEAGARGGAREDSHVFGNDLGSKTMERSIGAACYGAVPTQMHRDVQTGLLAHALGAHMSAVRKHRGMHQDCHVAVGLRIPPNAAYADGQKLCGRHRPWPSSLLDWAVEANPFVLGLHGEIAVVDFAGKAGRI